MIVSSVKGVNDKPLTDILFSDDPTVNVCNNL